ncbi:MAG: VanZ family protein [Calditrichia bacterium]
MSLNSRLQSNEKSLLQRALASDPFVNYYKWGALMYLLFSLFLLMWPFGFFLGGTLSHKPFLMNLPYGLVSLEPIFLFDIIGNVIFFVPLGFLLSGMLSKSSRLPFLRRLLYCTAFGFGLSFTVEFVQMWSPVRYSSILDLMTNTAGTAIGVFAYWLYSQVLKQHAKRIISSL